MPLFKFIATPTPIPKIASITITEFSEPKNEAKVLAELDENDNQAVILGMWLKTNLTPRTLNKIKSQW